MPWKECHVVDERLRFIARWLDGEQMARLCAEVENSRKTGLSGRSGPRAPSHSVHCADQLYPATSWANRLASPTRGMLLNMT